ncbi:MAG: hypothetical protein ACOY3N_06485 [Bradyrhizobium sp.]|uniref:hypothetical protein n=1 Tax=Bradyrhizobium sp. TaxID=376 RepID=UPI003BF2F5A5
MSPVGGVGVNLAVRDAVATAKPPGRQSAAGLPVRGRARCRAPPPRASGEDDATHAGGRAEKHHQRCLAERRPAAERVADPAPRHRAAMAPRHAGELACARGAARACAFEGRKIWRSNLVGITSH